MNCAGIIGCKKKVNKEGEVCGVCEKIRHDAEQDRLMEVLG